MYLFPVTVIEKVAAESRSGLAGAPTVPYEPPRPRRHPLRAVRRLLKPEVVETRPALTLLDGGGQELCEAELRDRGSKVAGAARAC
ncbi:hypothetical protein ACIBL3_01010 [Kribbella sp. NPDC050124]|uniref:hypothetical protein n=1 Tax=Kribbella sp. NPDC050124 TaxID=3364114 RepID=UPI0037B6B662